MSSKMKKESLKATPPAHSINLGGFTVSFNECLLHLKQDLRDDWFPDFLQYQDVLKESVIAEYVKANIESNHGRYEPGSKSVFNIPKSNVSLRYSLETDIVDRFVYQCTTSFLMKQLDPLLSKRVLSNRLETSQDSSRTKYLFRHRIDQWKIFEGISKYSLEDNKTLLVTDVQNYFENISILDIDRALRHLLENSTFKGELKMEIRCAIDTLVRCLNSWTFNGSTGLAQNRDASHFLSNVIMCKVDQYMQSKGYDYYRYVDDIRIICDSTFEAKMALKSLITQLRDIGLTLNPQKTVIFDRNDEAAKQKIFFGDNATIERIDSMFRSRSKYVIARSLPLIANYCKELAHTGKTQERTFRFCIDRLSNLLRCENFNLGDEYFQQLATDIIPLLEENAVSSDKLINFLSCCKLTQTHETDLIAFISNRERAIFTWQNYLLWKLFALKSIKSTVLEKLARSIVEEGEYSPEKNAAIIYLAKCAPDQLKTDLWQQMQGNKCFLFQRAVLLGLHQRDLTSNLAEIRKASIYSIQRTGSRLKNTDLEGVYIKPLDSFTFTDLYDQISAYE